jgi:hypothetical protein
MSEDKPEYLSAEALRNRLYHSLCDKGTVDSIKVEIRSFFFIIQINNQYSVNLWI